MSQVLWSWHPTTHTLQPLWLPPFHPRGTRASSTVVFQEPCSHPALLTSSHSRRAWHGRDLTQHHCPEQLVPPRTQGQPPCAPRQDQTSILLKSWWQTPRDFSSPGLAAPAPAACPAHFPSLSFAVFGASSSTVWFSLPQSLRF